MNLTCIWMCGFGGIILFILTVWLDDRDVDRFTAPERVYAREEERLLWLRLISRQVAALSLMLMLDAVFRSIAAVESARLMEASRFFLGVAEGANLLRLPYYHRLIRQTEQRARLLRSLRGGRT